MRLAHHYGFDSPPGIDPAPLLATLRSEEPVARVITPHGEESWLVTRYASVRDVLHDPRLSRAAAVTLGERVPRVSRYVNKTTFLSRFDPPEHTRLRQLVSGPFTKQRVQQHRPRAEEIASQLIDELVAAGPPADLVTGFAKRFPMLSLRELIGVPLAERDPSLTVTLPTLYGRDYTESEVLAVHARQKEHLAELLASRRELPQDDLLTAFLRLQQGTNRYTDEELIALMGDLMTNGTVGFYLANVLYVLLTHPEQLAWLRANLGRLPQAVEEVLRFVPLAPDAPAGSQGHVRLAVRDLELDGVTIRSGDWVLPTINSANRDERAFTDPDRLDLTRTRNRHLAFGFGTHHCPGAAVTRMQLQVAIRSLLTRLPHLALALPEQEVPWRTGMSTRTPERLPVTW